MQKIASVFPGEMLQEKFLKPFRPTPYRLTGGIDVPAALVCDMAFGELAVTAETELLLYRNFGLSKGWWLAVQSHHDADVACRELDKRLHKIAHCAQPDEATAYCSLTRSPPRYRSPHLKKIFAEFNGQF